MKNNFYFILKALFIFVLTVLVTYENGLIKKLRLISKFMTSSTGKQIITIHILANILRSTANQKMKNIFLFKNHAKNEARRLLPNFFFFFLKKVLNEEKKLVSTLAWIYFGSPWLGHTVRKNKKKLHKFSGCWSKEMLNFGILEKGLGLVPPPHFVYNSSRENFLMLYSINWPNFIAWLPLLLEILYNMCIVIICFPLDDVTNFEIYLNCLIKPFSYMS